MRWVRPLGKEEPNPRLRTLEPKCLPRLSARQSFMRTGVASLMSWCFWMPHSPRARIRWVMPQVKRVCVSCDASWQPSHRACVPTLNTGVIPCQVPLTSS